MKSGIKLSHEGRKEMEDFFSGGKYVQRHRGVRSLEDSWVCKIFHVAEEMEKDR